MEDAPSGVGAGKAAGCRVLGVVGTHSAEELRGADWIAGSLEGLAVTDGGGRAGAYGFCPWLDELAV